MKLLLLLSLIAFTLGEKAFVTEKATDINDVSQQATGDLQVQSNVQEATGDKKIAKRSYGWGPWGYVGGYGYGWPWYGYGGHGWYGGWYPSWPWWYSGYGGYGWSGHGGWYKKW